jgi:hypothetical protein
MLFALLLLLTCAASAVPAYQFCAYQLLPGRADTLPHHR